MIKAGYNVVVVVIAFLFQSVLGSNWRSLVVELDRKLDLGIFRANGFLLGS
jgi:hypothetical protein